VTASAGSLLLSIALSLAAAGLGVAEGTGPLLPLLAGLVVLAALVRARVALIVSFVLVGPLVAALGHGHARLEAAGALLCASALVGWLRARAQGARDDPADAVLAARIVLAGAAFIAAGSLASFVRILG
jgi:hypothetical protein